MFSELNILLLLMRPYKCMQEGRTEILCDDRKHVETHSAGNSNLVAVVSAPLLRCMS